MLSHRLFCTNHNPTKFKNPYLLLVATIAIVSIDILKDINKLHIWIYIIGIDNPDYQTLSFIE